MHVKTKTLAFGGLLLALAVLCMSLGSVLETSTFFLLAASSYFVGIVVREFGLRGGMAFYIAAVILGFIVSPNKFYVITFSAMGFYILSTEAVWIWLERRPQMNHRIQVYWAAKYILFNCVYLPVLLLFRELLFVREAGDIVILGAAVAGQAVLFVYDRAYGYFQLHIWNKMRGKILQ